MQVNELINIALDYLDDITIDEILRNIRNVIREINGVFMGVHKTVDVVKDGNVVSIDYLTNKKIADKVITIYSKTDNFIQVQNIALADKLSLGDLLSIKGYMRRAAKIEVADDIFTKITLDVPINEIINNTHDLFLIAEDNTITLTGDEKHIFNVLIDGNEAVKVRTVKELKEHKYSFIRPSYDKLIINYPDRETLPDVQIRGLFALDTKISRTSTIDLPSAYDGLLVSGMMYFFYRQPRYAVLNAVESMAQPFYQMLNNFSETMNSTLPPVGEQGNWDYYELRKR